MNLSLGLSLGFKIGKKQVSEDILLDPDRVTKVVDPDGNKIKEPEE